jgi:phytoene dehydrogenase-like protein
MQKYDVIVVGAGNAGLTAAVTTSKAGLKTLLLEKHNLPGGSATSFRRGRFEFEPSLHEMAQVGSVKNPGAVRDFFKKIGVDIDWHHHDATYRVISTDLAEKYDATMPCGIEAFCDEMERQVPGCRASVKRFFDFGVEGLKTMSGLGAGTIKPLELVTKHADFMRMASHSADQCMDLIGVPKKAQHILTTYWPYVGEATDTLNCMTFCMLLIVYVIYGAGMPGMFSHEISLALDKKIRENGGTIYYNCPVSKILIKDDKAYGVIANGEEFDADHIICNAFPNDVFGHMVDKEEIPPLEVKKANARDIALSFVTVYLGMNKSKEELGIKDYSIFLEHQADSKGQYENSFSLGGTGWVIVNCLNEVVPDCTPKGTCQVFFTTSVYGDIWGKVKPEDYKKTKMKVAEEMIDYYEKTLGISLKPYIEEIEVATPVTFARYLNTPNGTPYGYQVRSWDSILPRTMNLEKERTVKGLRFCGAHSERMDGYSSAYFSGEGTAEKTIADIKEGK